jgi:hypothetical protein
MQRQIIYDCLDQHQTHTGFRVPELLAWYLTDLLVERIRRVDIIPDPSFAERYLQLYHEQDLGQFKDYADSSLFFVSLMPEYGRRRGLDITYYASLGISTYYTLGDLAEDPRYTQLGNWYYDLQRFLNSLLHSHSQLDLWDLGSQDKYAKGE